MEFLGIAFITMLAFIGLAYTSAPFWAWSLSAGLTLLVLADLHLLLPISFLGTTSAVLFIFTLIYYVPNLRQRLMTQFLYRPLKNILPAMSTTEREAIDAGEVWFEGELFQGRPNWEQLLALPKPMLSSDETAFLNNQVDQLCAMIDDWKVTQYDLDLSPNVWAYLKQERFFGMIIPKEYGGLEFSALAHSTIVQKIASRCLTAAITTMVPNSLGPAELLMNYGTESQKQFYLPRLARGEEIPCFALTSQEAGSDASAIEDVGVICKGKFNNVEMIGMKLTWHKRYITLAPVATVLGLAFKLYDPEMLLGSVQDIGITVCLLPTSHPGVEIGKRHFPLNQPFMNGPTSGTEVFVPLDWIIGGPKMAGKGWHMLMECLSAGRGISLPALSTSAAKVSYRTTGAYAQIRKQFHTSIGKFEGVEAVLANMAGHSYLIEAIRLLTLTGLDMQLRPSIVTAIAKYHMTEMARVVMNNAMDVHGGRAIMLGPNNYLGRSYESIPISITVEGANILTRNLIIFGQGAIRCHPFIQKEIEALSNADSAVGIKKLDKVFFKHIQYTLSNIARAIVHSFSAGLFCVAPDVPELKKYYRQLGRMSIGLSLISDLSLILLGGKLKRSERISARLGDILSNLYIASAVLKYYKDFGNQAEDLHHVQWCLQFCLNRMQKAFFKIFKNFPLPLLGCLFQAVIFPFGRAYQIPRDKLEHKLATIMMLPTPFRDRLTQHCYLEDRNNPIQQLDATLLKMLNAEPALAKFEKALKKGAIPKNLDLKAKIDKAVSLTILSKEEASLILTFEKVRREAIKVDEFSKDQLVRK